MPWVVAARMRANTWCPARGLAGASPTTPPSCAAQPLGTARWRHAWLPVPPPAICRWLTWRGCWCWGQGRRNLRPHLDRWRFRCVFPVLSPPRPPAGRTRPPARNGFRFLLRYGQHGGCDWCGTVLSIPAHAAVGLRHPDELLVAVLQVDEVGGGDLRRMADFRRACWAEMQGWPAMVQLFSASVGSAEPVWTLGRGLGGSSEGGSPLTGRKVRRSIGERCPAGARPAVAAAGELAVLPRVCLPAAGRRLKTRFLGCCGAGRSLVVWV